MSKITQSAISWKPIDQNKNKKMVSWRIYFYTFILVLDSKIKIQMGKNLCQPFLTSVKSALNGRVNGSEVTYSKIQNSLSRAPKDTPMDRFLVPYLNNKCTLTLCESVKKVVLDIWWPVAPP